MITSFRDSVCAVATLLLLIIASTCSVNAAYLFTGQQYHTVMLGGSPTMQSITTLGSSFSLPENTVGDMLSVSACKLTHDRISIQSFSFDSSAMTVTPRNSSSGSGSPSLTTTIPDVNVVLSMPTFTVSCQFPQPFNGGVEIQITISGNATFSFSGPLSYEHDLNVTNGAVLVSEGSLLSLTPLTMHYGYTGVTSPFVFDPYVGLWFANRTEYLSTQLATYLISLGTDILQPLMNGGVFPLVTLESNSSCHVMVTDDNMLRVTSGGTCQSGVPPVFPGLPASSLQVIETTASSSSSSTFGTGSSAYSCTACQVDQCVLQFESTYQVDMTTEFCLLMGTEVSASMYSITGVVVVPQ